MTSRFGVRAPGFLLHCQSSRQGIQAKDGTFWRGAVPPGALRGFCSHSVTRLLSDPFGSPPRSASRTQARSRGLSKLSSEPLVVLLPGSRPPVVPLPEGTLTFLLTDVESSSPLWDRYPAEMPEAIARLDQILTGVISGRRGHLIRSKGEGDSAFAVFPSAGDAVAAAVEVLQALLAEPWPIPEGLRVRVGVLTGEAHLRDGDYFGSDINRCARLRGLAHGGQILVSESAAVLVRDTLAEGATLQDLGQHKLRGLTRPERIYQLTVPGLSAQFPPLASAEAENHNLPEQLTSFVGREREMETILELLGKSRCVTVVGAGGAGKTRLALQTAAQCLDHFPDGVWLVPLASLVQGEAIGQSAALAARLRVDPGRTADEVLVAYFRRRTALLVLDNCEHLAEECARWTEQLLQACPWVRVLVTSREALRIPGEIAWEIPTLEVPSAQDLPKLRGELVGALEQYEALRLFVARAQWARPGFELTRANAPSVVQICHRLDGLPLAIELAAARVRHLRPDQIEARLKDRFRLLTGGARTALAHHQTLRALFDWSYDYLDPQEQRLLRRLSLFSTPWSLDAAESAASGDGLEPEDVLDLMGRLVDRSLLIAEPGEGVEHQYRMLQTVREYARERLRESGEWDTAWQRYADYHLERSRTAEAALRGPTQAAWLDRLDRELDNFRSVLEWGLTQPGSVSVGIQTCINLFRFWYVRGYFSEGRVWLERLLSTGQPLDPARRSRALNEVGNLLAAQGDLESSQAALEEALLLSREAQDTRGVARTGCNLGMLAALRGDYPRARRAFEQSLVSFR
ncbi:MAG: adenylate/guanylate cyclase domain-containing protein, partial [Armatimonadetes bacterium]|nr:adenylate/guanylate cyclase domain-containing protein [Armatimonadota bacterium]